MSVADYSVSGAVSPQEVDLPLPASQPLHRIGTVRRLQGISRRAVARRMNVDVSVVRQQEQETADLPLSILYRWQQLLEVPVAELLVDAHEALSPSVMQRARMVRLMKTVLSILERSNQGNIREMAQRLADQLVELMPELKGISAWHAVGQRRRLNEYGRAADRRLSSDVFMGLVD